MRTLLSVFFLCFSLMSLAQDQQTNLQKYWRYRERLRQNFIVISSQVEDMGVNLPASAVNLSATAEHSPFVNWGDANNGMSHYLSVLATELWLLKSNRQDYSQTLAELYYAMLAMERLDLYSEFSLRGYHNKDQFVDPSTDINGFHLRDDVSQGFFNDNASHFDAAGLVSSYESHGMEESSQDNIFHNLEAFALIAKLLDGVESVANVPVTFRNPYIPNYLSAQGIMSGTDINFSLWAKDFVKRYLQFMQSSRLTFTMPMPWPFPDATLTDHWLLRNVVTNEPVQEGSGVDLDLGIFYNVGVVSAGNNITGESLRTQDPFIVSNSNAELTFMSMFNLGGDVPAITIPWPEPFPGSITIASSNYDRYKVSTLATTGNIEGQQTFDVLRADRDQHAATQPYEHFSLLYTILNDPSRTLMYPENSVYNADRVIIEDLLNQAPACGPTSYGNHLWSSDSRLVWPERLGDEAAENVEYSGLDYMMLHNLYYIAFRVEDFSNALFWPVSILGHPLFANGTFKFAHIDAVNVIPPSGNATYQATGSISFKPGFMAKAGCVLHAQIVPIRSNNYNGFDYKPISVTQCGGLVNGGGRIAATKTINNAKSNYAAAQYQPNTAQVPPAKIIEVKMSPEKLKEYSLTHKAITIYPNPTQGDLQVAFPYGIEGAVRFEVIAANGKISLTIVGQEQDFTIDTTSLGSGVYILKAYLPKGGVIVEKFTVIR